MLAQAPEVAAASLPAGRRMYRVYSTRCGYDEFNPGLGDSRFGPIDALATRRRVPTLYLADDPLGALLETVFHDVHHEADRNVFEKDLRLVEGVGRLQVDELARGLRATVQPAG